MTRPACLCVIGVLGLLLAGPAPAQDTPDGTEAFSDINGQRLAPTTLGYDVTLRVQGRSIDLSATRTLRKTETDGVETWTVVDRTVLPQTTVTDSLILDRHTLRPRSQYRLGPVTMHLTYTDTSATGTVRGRGEPRSIDERFDTPVLADEMSAQLALATLSFGPDLSTQFPVFSAQEGTRLSLTFEVTGIDTVDTPAGTFETFVVSMGATVGSAEGTLHVRQTAPHHVVKSTLTQTGPQGAPRTIVRTLTSME